MKQSLLKELKEDHELAVEKKKLNTYSDFLAKGNHFNPAYLAPADAKVKPTKQNSSEHMFRMETGKLSTSRTFDEAPSMFDILKVASGYDKLKRPE